MSIGKRAYLAHSDAGGGIMPRWDELTHEQRRAWELAATAVAQEVLDGVSSMVRGVCDEIARQGRAS